MFDCWGLIYSLTDDQETLGAITMTCRAFSKMLTNVMIDKCVRHVEFVLRLRPELVDSVSLRHVSQKFIDDHPEMNFSLTKLSRNLNLSKEFIERHLDGKWTLKHLSHHPAITIYTLIARPSRGWNVPVIVYRQFSSLDEVPNERYLRLQYVLGDPKSVFSDLRPFVRMLLPAIMRHSATAMTDDEMWNYVMSSADNKHSIMLHGCSDSVMMKVMQVALKCTNNVLWSKIARIVPCEVIDKNRVKPWHKSSLLAVTNIFNDDFDRITQDVPPLGRYSMSFNRHLTADFLTARVDSPVWDWRGLSGSPALTIKFILENRHLRWNWDVVSARCDLTLSVLRENVQWNWARVSRWVRLTTDDFIAMREGLPLVKEELLLNRTITYSIIKLL